MTKEIASAAAKSRKRIKSLRRKCWEYSNLPYKRVALIIFDERKSEWSIFNSESGTDWPPSMSEIVRSSEILTSPLNEHR